MRLLTTFRLAGLFPRVVQNSFPSKERKHSSVDSFPFFRASTPYSNETCLALSCPWSRPSLCGVGLSPHPASPHPDTTSPSRHRSTNSISFNPPPAAPPKPQQHLRFSSNSPPPGGKAGNRGPGKHRQRGRRGCRASQSTGVRGTRVGRLRPRAVQTVPCKRPGAKRGHEHPSGQPEKVLRVHAEE